MYALQSKAAEDLKNFLESKQYSRKSILRYEKIFGKRYVSTGGEVTTAEFCAQMGLKPDMKILDVGSGIGGSAFFMAKTFGVYVDGVDLSSNMVEIAQEYLSDMPEEVKSKVSFRVADATSMEYPENFYDIVYSRDTILHIEDKKSLFEHFYRSLKPGGRVVITDYCRGDLDQQGRGDYEKDFKEYVAERGYHLLTVKGYGDVLRSAGFADVSAVDMTKEFIEILHRELDAFQLIRDEVVAEYSSEDFDDICKGWEDKVIRCHRGDQAWGYFVAKKSS